MRYDGIRPDGRHAVARRAPYPEGDPGAPAQGRIAVVFVQVWPAGTPRSPQANAPGSDLEWPRGNAKAPAHGERDGIRPGWPAGTPRSPRINAPKSPPEVTPSTGRFSYSYRDARLAPGGPTLDKGLDTMTGCSPAYRAPTLEPPRSIPLRTPVLLSQ